MKYTNYEVLHVPVNGVMLKKYKYLVTLGKTQFKVKVKIDVEQNIYNLLTIIQVQL